MGQCLTKLTQTKDGGHQILDGLKTITKQSGFMILFGRLPVIQMVGTTP